MIQSHDPVICPSRVHVTGLGISLPLFGSRSQKEEGGGEEFAHGRAGKRKKDSIWLVRKLYFKRAVRSFL